MRNQILSISVNNNKTKNKNRNVNKSQPADIKKIITFFAIITIIFSIGIIGVSSYAVAENYNILSIGKPELIIEQKEDKLEIKINSKKIINKIVYNWNHSENKEITGIQNTQVNEQIDLPVGSNSLYITVYDINGKTYEYQENYNIEAVAPQLSIMAESGKIKIVAKDNEKMANIRYRWDDEEEIIVNATEESSAQIEEEIEIPKGTHTLYVIAINAREIETTRTQEVKGVTKPEIKVVQDSTNLKYLILNVSDENAVKLVEYDLNGKKYRLDLSDYTEKEIQYRQVLDEGHNVIKITATNFDGAETTFEGECDYNP